MSVGYPGSSHFIDRNRRLDQHLPFSTLLVRVNYEDEDKEDDDDDEMHCLLLMQKADTYVTAATSLISLSTSQSRAIHAYIDRFISR